MIFAETRARLAAAAVSLVFVFTLGTAQAATPAESFVQDNVQKGLVILNDHAMSAEEKRTRFQSFLENLTDVRRVALFTLGPAVKTASSADIDAFVEAFRAFGSAVYQQQLAGYSGGALTVTGSIERGPGDFVVQTKSSDGGDEVDFRVDAQNNSFVILDASVSGAWLAVDQRDQFAAFLAAHNGDVKALAAELTARAASMRG